MKLAVSIWLQNGDLSSLFTTIHHISITVVPVPKNHFRKKIPRKKNLHLLIYLGTYLGRYLYTNNVIQIIFGKWLDILVYYIHELVKIWMLQVGHLYQQYRIHWVILRNNGFLSLLLIYLKPCGPMNLCLLTFDLLIVLPKHKASFIFCKGETKLIGSKTC